MDDDFTKEPMTTGEAVNKLHEFTHKYAKVLKRLIHIKESTREDSFFSAAKQAGNVDMIKGLFEVLCHLERDVRKVEKALIRRQAEKRTPQGKQQGKT